MNSILGLTKQDLDRLSERYGNLFFSAYEKELRRTIKTQEMIDSLLAKQKDTEITERYGHLLDKYIQ